MYFSIFIVVFCISFLAIISMYLMYRFYQNEKQATLKMKANAIYLIEEEKRRIANDLHDSCSSVLVNFNFKINQLKALHQFNESLVQSLEEMNLNLMLLNQELIDNIENIYPKELLLGSWEDAIINQAQRFSSLGQIVECDIGEVPRFSTNLQLQTFRIIQELITNICKHGNTNYTLLQIFTNENLVNVCLMYDSVSKKWYNHLISYARGSASIKGRLELIGGNIVGPRKLHGSLNEIIFTFPIYGYDS